MSLHDVTTDEKKGQRVKRGRRRPVSKSAVDPSTQTSLSAIGREPTATHSFQDTHSETREREAGEEEGSTPLNSSQERQTKLRKINSFSVF